MGYELTVADTGTVTALVNNTSTKNELGVAALKVALDQNASTTEQLLASLPQKDGTGKLVDVHA